MKTRIMVLACVAAVSCGKGGEAEQQAKPPPPAVAGADAAPRTDPACAAKVKELEPWVAQLYLEASSHEIDFGSVLQVIDRSPFPVDQHVDNVEIRASSINAYDASERDHAQTNLGQAPAQAAIVERLTALRKQTPEPGERGRGPEDVLRFDVDHRASWRDVARVAEAATKAGYTQAVLAFTATSKLAPPPGEPPVATDADAVSAAGRRLEELRAQCKPWDRALLRQTALPSRIDNARAIAKATVAGLLECNCAVDLDEVRKLMWRDQRWHQARARVGVAVRLAADATTEIAQPAKTPWSEAHRKILEAAPEGAAPPALKLVAK